MKRLKILAMAVVLFLMGAPAKAEPIELDLKIVKLVLPFQDVYTTYLYDFVLEQNMGGVETPVLKSGKWRGLIGMADVEGSETAIPYLGADVEVSDRYFGQRFSVGAWLGRDSEIGHTRGGLKASIQLW